MKINNPKYLETYKMFAEVKPHGKLNGDRLLVEIITKANEEEVSKGGIILATSTNQRSDFDMLKSVAAVVLEVGSGYFDPDTKEDIPLSTKVGQVVWLADANIRVLTTVPHHTTALPEKVIALANESSVIKSWPTLEAFESDRAIFNNLSKETLSE